MDETCVWLQKLLAWVDRCGPPPVPYAGRAGAGYHNPPAPHVELALVLDAEVRELSIGERCVNVPARHLVFHNNHLGAYTPTMQPMDAWCVILDVEGEREFRSLEKSALFCASPLERHDEVVEAFERVGARCTRFGTGPLHYLAPEPLYDPKRDGPASSVSAALVKAALLELLALLLEELAPGTGAPASRLPIAVQRAVEFMSLHYRRAGLSLEDVAHAAGLSEDHFGRAFRAATGETPMRHLKRIRVDQSRYLLEHTSLRVEEVAAEVGFADALHFSRVFKRETGTSPSAWRARRR